LDGLFQSTVNYIEILGGRRKGREGRGKERRREKITPEHHA
jgi:hypothetical protein